jgi:hypothetical protein
MSAQKEKEAAQMTADMIRLAEVRKARAEKEAAARQLAIDKLSKELSGLAVSQARPTSPRVRRLWVREAVLMG